MEKNKTTPNIIDLFVSSANDLTNIRKLMTMSMLAALLVAVDFVTIRLPVGEDLRVKFTFVFMAVCGFLFGPVATALVALVADIIIHVIIFGDFFPGFTLNVILSGMIYGLCLYKKNYKSRYFIIWCALAKILVNFFINITLTPIWNNMIMGRAGAIFTVIRIYKNVMLLPVEIIVMYIVIKYIASLTKKMQIYK